MSEVSIVTLTFCMMSETQWMAVENVASVFFSKLSIINKLPVSYNVAFLAYKHFKQLRSTPCSTPSFCNYPETK